MIRYIHPLIVIEKDDETFVIVPAEDVLLTHAILPKLSRERLKQALPFALEEQLVADVNQLHFATADREPDGTLPVAVVAIDKMKEWLALLAASNISPHVMTPSTLALPFTPDHFHVYNCDNVSLIRTGKFSGCTLNTENLTDFIEAHLMIQRECSPQILEEQLQLGLFSTPHINLLQGAYPAKRKNTHTKNFWKLAGFAALGWIGLVFIGQLISFFILHHVDSGLNAKITAIYQREFPHAKQVIAVRERMEQKLKTVSTEASKNNFLSLLATLSKSVAEHHSVRLQNLTYAQNILTLDVSASSFDALNALTEDLTNHDLNVKQQNAMTIGTQVKATLLISAGVS